MSNNATSKPSAVREPRPSIRARRGGPSSERQRAAQGRRPAPGRPQAGRLDTTAIYPAAAGDEGRSARRRSRFRARAVLWDVSTLQRVRDCGRVAVLPGGSVALVVSEGEPRQRVAGWRGVASCGSVWACPRCSAVIGQHRANELREALDTWRARGGTAALLTLTIRHHNGQRLADLWSAVSESFSALVSGRPWKTFKNATNLAGVVRVAEVTHGAAGFHMHLHVLLFLDARHDPFEAHYSVLSARGPVLAAWQRIVARRGYSAVEDALDLRPVNLTHGENALGNYFQKNSWDAADEVARGASKTARRANRTPMAILRDFAETGDVADLDLWREWERASKGRRQMTWSRGLRDQLLSGGEHDDAEVAADSDDGTEEITDEQIAASLDRGDAAVAVFDAVTWRFIRRSSLLYELLDVAESAAGDVGPAVDAALQSRMTNRLDQLRQL
ncbi:MAG: protein rep [Jatrophihabitantaceae bacterium]